MKDLSSYFFKAGKCQMAEHICPKAVMPTQSMLVFSVFDLCRFIYTLPNFQCSQFSLKNIQCSRL